MRRHTWEQTVGNHYPYEPWGRPTYIASVDTDFGIVGGEIDTVNPKARWEDSPSPKDGGYTLRITRYDKEIWNNQLDSHQQYKNIVGDQLDTTNAPVIQDAMHNVTETLYEKRPNFPRVFNSLSRAQFVGDLLINRTVEGKPMTPRPRRRA